MRHPPALRDDLAGSIDVPTFADYRAAHGPATEWSPGGAWLVRGAELAGFRQAWAELYDAAVEEFHRDGREPLASEARELAALEREVRSWAAELGVYRSLDPRSDDPAIRAATVELERRGVDLAAELEFRSARGWDTNTDGPVIDRLDTDLRAASEALDGAHKVQGSCLHLRRRMPKFSASVR